MVRKFYFNFNRRTYYIIFNELNFCFFSVETDSIDFDTNFGWNEDTSASENEDDTSGKLIYCVIFCQ